MAENQILTFAGTDTGTNLLTQAEYVSDAQRPIGNQPGIARSKLVNKALRQSSLLAAGLAEFIADYQANNVTDSLTPQNIADYLLNAINLAIASASETTQGKIELATQAEVQAGSDAIRAVTPAGLSSRTATTGRTGLTALATPEEAAATISTKAMTPSAMPYAFPFSPNQNGYLKLPSGLIIQWVTGYATGGDQEQTITFPIAFPNARLSATVGTLAQSINLDDAYCQELTGVANPKTSIRVASQYQGGGTVTGVTPKVIAIGF